VLFENAAGFALFVRNESDEIGDQLEAFQADVQDYARFSRLVKLVSFLHFTSSDQALENIKVIAEGT
jgi:nucleolar protein 56